MPRIIERKQGQYRMDQSFQLQFSLAVCIYIYADTFDHRSCSLHLIDSLCVQRWVNVTRQGKWVIQRNLVKKHDK